MCPAPRLPRAGCHQLVLTNREELSFFTVLAFPKASSIGLACSSCRSSSPCGGTQSLIRARWQCGLSPTHQEQRPAGRALVAATLPNSFLLGLCTQADQKLTCEEIRKLLALGKSAQEWEDKIQPASLCQFPLCPLAFCPSVYLIPTISLCIQGQPSGPQKTQVIPSRQSQWRCSYGLLPLVLP